MSILKAAPTHPGATLILGVARRRGGDAAAALEVLRPLVQSQPRWAAARYELGVALGDVGAGEQAVIELRRAVELNPEMPEAWRSLADHLAAMGDDASADTGPGGFNRRTQAPPDPPLSTYEPDYLTNYELGFKTSWLDNHLRFNGAFFWEEWKNFQFGFLGQNSFTIVRNAG